MSSGQSKTTSSTEMPAWMRPYGQSYLSKASNIADRPYQAYGGQTVAGMDPRMRQGIDQQAQLGTNGTAAGNAGAGALNDTLSGKYLHANSNPYLSGQIDAAQGDVIRNYNTVAKPQMESAMARSGSFGNAGLMQLQQGQQSDLQRNLGRIGSDMRMGAYNTERGDMQSAMSMAPQYNNMAFGNAQALQDAGRMQQGQQQTEMSDAYRKWQEAQGYDARQLGVMGDALGNLRGNSVQTQTQSQGSNGLSNVVGASLATDALFPTLFPAIASMFSDRRVKTDIKKVGKTDDGLNVYTYKYKWGGPTQMGVMAQEVEKKNPEAVAKTRDGVRMVNYGLLGG